MPLQWRNQIWQSLEEGSGKRCSESVGVYVRMLAEQDQTDTVRFSLQCQPRSEPNTKNWFTTSRKAMLGVWLDRNKFTRTGPRPLDNLRPASIWRQCVRTNRKKGSRQKSTSRAVRKTSLDPSSLIYKLYSQSWLEANLQSGVGRVGWGGVW